MHSALIKQTSRTSKYLRTQIQCIHSTRNLRKSPLRILGLESSCDDTAAAIVADNGEILSESTMHQYKVHEPHGGIVPSLAANHHLKNIPLVVHSVLAKAQLKVDDLDAIAVTRGPGLPASLAVCVAAGKTLAAAHSKPLIGVHHMEAHALMARMTSHVSFPYLCLLISGGHTLTLIVHDVNHYTQLGTTRDDSVGEAFDKIARELEIPWTDGPGPALELVARDGDPNRFVLPVPMDKSTSAKLLDFSFSGLKTKIRRMRANAEFDIANAQDRADVASAFQRTATKHICKKVALAFARAREMGVELTALVASGGVASNLVVRDGLDAVAERNYVPLVCPPPRLCTDNGVMIAWAGIERFKKGLLDPYTIDFIQRWPLEQLKTMGYERRESSF